MARPLRIEFPGAIYHVTSRGNAYQPIFISDKDRAYFLKVLSSVIERFKWNCHAYCLMENHYHLLIETQEGNLSKGMRQLNGVYTQWFNKAHNRVGHIFQGRYKAILIEKESYLLELCRYVVLNPVRAGIVKKAEEWQWSSYRATVGLERKPKFLTIDWILGQFSEDKNEAIAAYCRFVGEGIRKRRPWENLKGQVLGSGQFLNKVSEIVKRKEKIKEIPKAQRYATRPGLERLIKGDDKKKRNKEIFEAHVKFGYSLKEIGDHLGLHYTTISKIIASQLKREVKFTIQDLTPILLP